MLNGKVVQTRVAMYDLFGRKFPRGKRWRVLLGGTVQEWGTNGYLLIDNAGNIPYRRDVYATRAIERVIDERDLILVSENS